MRSVHVWNKIECIEVDGGEDNFLDIVDDFDGMSDEDDEDVSFVSMGGMCARAIGHCVRARLRVHLMTCVACANAPTYVRANPRVCRRKRRG